MRKSLPRVTEVEISELGFDLGSVWFCPLYGVASIGYALCFSLLLCVSPEGLKGLSLTLRSNYSWKRQRSRIRLVSGHYCSCDRWAGGGWRRAKSLEKGLGVSIERDGWDRRDGPPFFLQNTSHHVPHPEFCL